MQKIILALPFVVIAFTAHAWTDPTLKFEQDAYGPGVHSDQYGRIYRTEPGLEIKQNAYGPGVHADQYGRVIQPTPATPSRTFKERLKDWGLVD